VHFLLEQPHLSIRLLTRDLSAASLTPRPPCVGDWSLMPWERPLGDKLQLHSVWFAHYTWSSIIYRTSLQVMREGTSSIHEHVVGRSLISGHALPPRALDPQHSR
jgi:hypothetical protein